MPQKSIKNKILAYMCAKCFRTDADKLAWFFSSTSVFSDCLLCKQCFKQSFKCLPNVFKSAGMFSEELSAKLDEQTFMLRHPRKACTMRDLANAVDSKVLFFVKYNVFKTMVQTKRLKKTRF